MLKRHQWHPETGTPLNSHDTMESETLPQQELQDDEHTFGAFAYERALNKMECEKVQRMERRFAESVDGTVHVWVQDARPFAHGKESPVETFMLRVHASLPVAEVRDRVQERFEQISNYREQRDGSLQLSFGGRTLENGKLLAEYLGDKKASPRWPTPFAGILWVVPFGPKTRLAAHLWSA